MKREFLLGLPFVAVLLPIVLVASVEPARGAPSTTDPVGLCLDLPREPGVEACRRALGAGLDSRRAALIRGVLAGKLAGLKRWDEVVDVYREAVRVEPNDASAHLRLGTSLFYVAGRPEEAAHFLREAIRLDPNDPLAHGTLGVALNATGDHAEAVVALERAVELDPEYLGSRPASRHVLEAARRGESWP